VLPPQQATQAKAGKRNRFAKVATLSSNRPGEAELIELLGPIGDYASELEAYQLHFGIKPCKYPPKETWGIRDEGGPPAGPPGLSLPPGCSGDSTRIDCTHLHCLSVDNASTRDIDDAISIQVGEGEAGTGGTVTLGIHIADVAAHVPCGSTLFEWAFARAGSAYHGGIVGGLPVGSSGVPSAPVDPPDPSLCGGSVPMLPPELAHGSFSLNEGVPRDALSLFLTIKNGKIEKR
jgi:exoribonuclease R